MRLWSRRRLFVGHAGQRDQGNAQNRHCADGHGFADDAGDDADEQRQKVPCVGRYALRHGDDEPDNQRQRERNRSRNWLEADVESPSLRYRGIGFQTTCA